MCKQYTVPQTQIHKVLVLVAVTAMYWYVPGATQTPSPASSGDIVVQEESIHSLSALSAVCRYVYVHV